MEMTLVLALAVFAVTVAITFVVIRAARGSHPNEPTRDPHQPGALDREGIASRRAKPEELGPASERLANRT